MPELLAALDAFRQGAPPGAGSWTPGVRRAVPNYPALCNAGMVVMKERRKGVPQKAIPGKAPALTSRISLTGRAALQLLSRSRYY